MIIIRKYHSGVMNYVEVVVSTTVFVRENYTKSGFSWYQGANSSYTQTLCSDEMNKQLEKQYQYLLLPEKQQLRIKKLRKLI